MEEKGVFVIANKDYREYEDNEDMERPTMLIITSFNVGEGFSIEELLTKHGYGNFECYEATGVTNNGNNYRFACLFGMYKYLGYIQFHYFPQIYQAICIEIDHLPNPEEVEDAISKVTDKISVYEINCDYETSSISRMKTVKFLRKYKMKLKRSLKSMKDSKKIKEVNEQIKAIDKRIDIVEKIEKESNKYKPK